MDPLAFETSTAPEWFLLKRVYGDGSKETLEVMQFLALSQSLSWMCCADKRETEMRRVFAVSCFTIYTTVQGRKGTKY